MKKFLSLIFIFVCLLETFFLTACKNKEKKFTDYSFDYFDTVTTIVGFETTEEAFKQNCVKIKAWLEEYHKLYDIYTVYDGITNLCIINNSNGKTLKVDSKITDLLTYSKELYNKTNGKLNIAMGSVLSIWHDYREYGLNNPEKAELPPQKLLNTAAKHTDINDLVIDNNSITLTDSEMCLDVGAIAKGYAAEKVSELMKSQNISGYILNIGGNVKIVGERPDGEKWKVGIENPDTEDTETPYIEELSLGEMSLVTSGSYQRFYEVGGKSYHHIIDPDTLMPAVSFKSVSVLCENSALADAFSTALFCMSYEDGRKLVQATDNLYVMWVLENGEQLYSDGFKEYCKN